MPTQNVLVTLTLAGINTGNFSITDNLSNLIGDNISRTNLLLGMTYSVDVNATSLIIQSNDLCTNYISVLIPTTTTTTTMPPPTFIEISNTGIVGGTRTQIFQVGNNIIIGAIYRVEVYSHPVLYTTIAGDTPTSIATALKNAINSTTESQWNSASSAPPHGRVGFPPTATSSGSNLTITLNFQNIFSLQVTF